VRHLSFGKLALVLPLPGRSNSTLDAFDAAASKGAPPAVPTVAGLSPYTVQWLLTRPNGVSQVLDTDDAVFELAGFERLSLGNVAVQVKPKEA
jgi:hypothetical protein